jgi:hypothetical protein
MWAERVSLKALTVNHDKPTYVRVERAMQCFHDKRARVEYIGRLSIMLRTCNATSWFSMLRGFVRLFLFMDIQFRGSLARIKGQCILFA